MITKSNTKAKLFGEKLKNTFSESGVNKFDNDHLEKVKNSNIQWREKTKFSKATKIKEIDLAIAIKSLNNKTSNDHYGVNTLIKH